MEINPIAYFRSPLGEKFGTPRQAGLVPDLPGTVEFCDRLGREPLAFQPGTHWRYSTCADVLGAVVELVSGKSFSRFLRELGGALVSPMKGLKRLLTGEAWHQKSRNYLYHDYSRIPVSYSISLGSRYLADDRSLFRGEHNPYLELGMEYGDAYDNEENKPFSYFRSNVTFGFSSNQPAINRLNLMGRIWGTPIADTKKLEADFGIFQHFNFYNSFRWIKDYTLS